MYPIILEGVLKPKIWGGHNLDRFGKVTKEALVGESWEVSCHQNGDNKIQNGLYEGKSLCEVLKIEKDHIINDKYQQFPLLVKLIDAQEPLSIQVHPDDEYAKLKFNSLGKTEAWYIVSAEENAEIVLGTHGVSVDKLLAELSVGDESHLNHITVKEGDFFFVPSGTVHGIGKGIVLLEVQQNSDITFRVYDYGRGRELHLEDAKNTIKIESGCGKCEGRTKDYEGHTITEYIKNSMFTIEKVVIHQNYHLISNEHIFQTYTCIEGSGAVVYDHKAEKISRGDSILVPRDVEDYRIVGDMTMIKAYISGNS